MMWNMAPEWLSLVILTIIITYAFRGMTLYTLREKIFRTSLIVTFLSIITNILSTYMVYAIDYFPTWIVLVATTLHFIVMPFIAVVFFFYAVAVFNYSCSATKMQPAWALFLTPYIVYFFMIIMNLWKGNIFQISNASGFLFNRNIIATYIIFGFYCLGIVVLTIVNHKRVKKVIVYIFLAFPTISSFFMILQIIFNDLILTGSSATITILLIYLYLQSKELSTDMLTGLLNRRSLIKVGVSALKAKQKGIFIVVSMNDFKTVNDHFGQLRGDDLLCQVAQFLKDILSNILVYRISGDRFAFYLFENRMSELESIAVKIKKRFKESWQSGRVECMLSAHIAVAESQDVDGSMEIAIRGIEYALQECKKNPLNLYCRYDPKMRQTECRYRDVKNALCDALKNNGFYLFYQPIWSVREQRFVQAEALLRLNQTAIPDLYPDEFIPIAEETGLIVDITYWVLDQVCGFIKYMDEKAHEYKADTLERISVNFSFLQFLQPELKQRLLDIFSNHEIAPSRIKIEVTERLLMTEDKLVTNFMEEVSALGVGFALDDFGVGYSNIEALLDIPFDAIKLDKGLVWSTMGHEKKEKFLNNLIVGFKELNRHVIAEGVETKEQYRFVCNCGCDYIQGYYFAKPMAEKECCKFIIEKNKK